MSMPPRQPRPAMVGGTPSRHGPPPNLDGMSFEQITQRALDISRKLEPAIRYFPAVGPALDMADDLRDGDYGGALFNGAMLAADLTPIGPVAKTGSTMFKLYRRYGRGLASAQAMQKRLIPEWRVIAVVGENDGVTQQTICAMTRMDKVTISRAAIALVGRGLIARAPNRADRRSRRLALTKAGRKLYADVAPKALEFESRIFDHFPPEELDRFMTMLRAIEARALEVGES